MKITFSKSPAGKSISLQSVRKVYKIDSRGNAYECYADATEGDQPIYVSHRETCPKASSLSKRRRS